MEPEPERKGGVPEYRKLGFSGTGLWYEEALSDEDWVEPEPERNFMGGKPWYRKLGSSGTGLWYGTRGVVPAPLEK